MDLACRRHHWFVCRPDFLGVDIYRKIPPVPDKVITTDGKVVATGQDIKDGQNVWQSIGGQTVGSIWGHGAYIAPDWSADYLHRESLLLLEELAKKEGKSIKIYRMTSRQNIRYY
jgi:nitric oxide reductase subunit B